MSDQTATTVTADAGRGSSPRHRETLDGPPRETLLGPPVSLEQPVLLTDRAAVKVREFLAQQDDQATEDVALRIAVQAGGCAGMQYALFFDDRQLDGDRESVQHGVTIRVDGQSATHLTGATVDWKESLEASGFSIDNPSASSSCACGDSFS